MPRATSKLNGKVKSKPTPMNANAVTVADRRDALFHKWPIRYDQRFAEMGQKMVRFLGATEREVATCLGIPEWKLKDWKKQHPDFADALREARAVVDAEVATRLYQRAMGYEQRATKMFPVQTVRYEPGEDGKPLRFTDTEIVEREYVEYHPPDTDAAKFWLKNRQPALWREMSYRESAERHMHAVFDFSSEHMTDEQLNAAIEALSAVLSDDQRRRVDEFLGRAPRTIDLAPGGAETSAASTTPEADEAI